MKSPRSALRHSTPAHPLATTAPTSYRLSESPYRIQLHKAQNDLHLNSVELNKSNDEVKGLRNQVAAKDKWIKEKSKELADTKDRLLKSEQQLSSTKNELKSVVAAKGKLERQLKHAEAHLEKITKQLHHLADKSSGGSDGTGALVAQLRGKQPGQEQDEKTLQAMMRVKDKAVKDLKARLDHAQRLEDQNVRLQNELKQTERQLGQQVDENRAKGQQMRLVERAAQDLKREVEEKGQSIKQQEHQMADMEADIASKVRGNKALQLELDLVRDELIRVRTVAARVSAAEVVTEMHGEGTIPVLQHLEEVNHLQGEIARLKAKVAAADKEAAAVRKVKEVYRDRLEAVDVVPVQAVGKTPLSPTGLSSGQDRPASPLQLRSLLDKKDRELAALRHKIDGVGQAFNSAKERLSPELGALKEVIAQLQEEVHTADSQLEKKETALHAELRKIQLIHDNATATVLSSSKSPAGNPRKAR